MDNPYSENGQMRKYLMEMILDILWEQKDRYDHTATDQQYPIIADVKAMLYMIKREERLQILERVEWPDLQSYCREWEVFFDDEYESMMRAEQWNAMMRDEQERNVLDSPDAGYWIRQQS